MVLLRVYGYVRVSTKGQAPGTSLDEQTAEILEKYPTAVIVREVASGASERPEFVKICEQLESGDTLAVCKLDRFCRTAKEGLGYVDYLRGKSVAVHILNMGVIDNSPMGRLMVTMLLAFAEFERALIIERTQTGKATARSRTGFRDGRPPKFTPEQIDHAIGLLETHSYKQVTKMTGISRSTLQRENRKRRNQ
ncbi:recombinase family protein [Gemmiger formicilis]